MGIYCFHSRLIFLCNGHFDGAELYRLSLSKKSKTVLTVSIQKKYQNTKGKQEMSEKVFITVTGKIKEKNFWHRCLGLIAMYENLPKMAYLFPYHLTVFIVLVL